MIPIQMEKFSKGQNPCVQRLLDPRSVTVPGRLRGVENGCQYSACDELELCMAKLVSNLLDRTCSRTA